MAIQFVVITCQLMSADSVWDRREEPLGLRTGLEKAEVKLGVQMRVGKRWGW